MRKLACKLVQMIKQGDNDLASKVKMERNGCIWDIF